MDPKTYTIISDKGGGAIIVKKSGANMSIALTFFTTINGIKGEILSEPAIKLKVIEAESSERAYTDSCEWTKTNIDQECEFEEGHEFIDTVNNIIKSVENQEKPPI